jgi:hypothetical protein
VMHAGHSMDSPANTLERIYGAGNRTCVKQPNIDALLP